MLKILIHDPKYAAGSEKDLFLLIKKKKPIYSFPMSYYSIEGEKSLETVRFLGAIVVREGLFGGNYHIYKIYQKDENPPYYIDFYE